MPDDAALRLIDGPPPTANGKRPRFRLEGEQVEIFAQLREIDRHVADIFGDAAVWLARTGAAPEFQKRSAIDHMVRNGRRGIAELLRFLQQQSFKASLRS